MLRSSQLGAERDGVAGQFVSLVQRARMIFPRQRTAWSLVGLFVFTWTLLLLIQQTTRFFLLPETIQREAPTVGVLVKTFLGGLLADVVPTTAGMVGVSLLAALFAIPLCLLAPRLGDAYRRAFFVSMILFAGLLLLWGTVDVGYFGYIQQHPDFIFFEYVGELIESNLSNPSASQAVQQTDAELEDASKWVRRIGSFLFLQGAVILSWWWVFRRRLEPMLAHRWSRHPLMWSSAWTLPLVIGFVGMSPFHLPSSQVLVIDREPYFVLAQNSIMFAREPFRAALLSGWAKVPLPSGQAMTMEEAVSITQQSLGHGATFPSREFPLARTSPEVGGAWFERPLNVLLIFVEGLDRRYLGRIVVVPGGAAGGREIRVTPFLDQLKDDSLYFEHFFANGVQTSRGLFATFCSYAPRQGAAVIKTRANRDYLCLPAALRQAGYRTEMVTAGDGDLRGLRAFMERNGLDRLYGEQDFPANADRLAGRITDAALFAAARQRMEMLHGARQPYFFSILTVSMHHPFAVPFTHPDVPALQAEPDRYLAALRYFDLEFERFFTSLVREGILDNTMVLVLGDHGRHEAVGTSDIEREVGHFLAPLLIWVDPALRSPDKFRPRTVTEVASQIDLAPTILAVNGLTPPLAPFLGRNLSCLFVTECLAENQAYLSSVYDDLIGLADHDGIWLYSFRHEAFLRTDFDAKQPVTRMTVADANAHDQYRRLLALYLTTNRLLEDGRVWSGKHMEWKLHVEPMN